MKHIICTIVLVLCAFLANAQDKIIKKDYTLLSVQIKEIGEDYVLYKDLNNLSGPDYRLSSDSIGKIILENGEEILFVTTQASSEQDLSNDDIEYPNAGELERFRNSYRINGFEIPDEDLIKYIGSYNYNNTYLDAVKQKKAGTALMISGGASIAIGTALMIIGLSEYEPLPYYLGSSMITVGSITLNVGIPLFCIGKSRLNWIEEDYNEKASKYPNVSMSLTGCRNGYGLGIALNF